MKTYLKFLFFRIIFHHPLDVQHGKKNLKNFIFTKILTFVVFYIFFGCLNRNNSLNKGPTDLIIFLKLWKKQ